MRLLKRWGYLLFVVALVLGSLLWFRDFTGAVMALSFASWPVIHRNLVKSNQTRWLLPCGMALALLLAVLYYVGDLIIFPHSLRSAHRLQDACLTGALWAASGLLAEVYLPAEKRVAKDHVLKDTATERRR